MSTNWASGGEFQGMNTIPHWVNWLAQDADGAWWGFEVEPHQHHAGWYENELGRCIRIRQDVPNADWALTLTRYRPK